MVVSVWLETVTMTERLEAEVEVAEMRMIKIFIRKGKDGQKRRLQWFGYVRREAEGGVLKMV